MAQRIQVLQGHAAKVRAQRDRPGNGRKDVDQQSSEQRGHCLLDCLGPWSRETAMEPGNGGARAMEVRAERSRHGGAMGQATLRTRHGVCVCVCEPALNEQRDHLLLLSATGQHLRRRKRASFQWLD